MKLNDIIINILNKIFILTLFGGAFLINQVSGLEELQTNCFPATEKEIAIGLVVTHNF